MISNLVEWAKSVKQGVRVLLWPSKEELAWAFIAIHARLESQRIAYMLCPTDHNALEGLADNLKEHRVVDAGDASGRTTDTAPLFLFIPQGASNVLGPWLNGSRLVLAEPPGTVIVVRLEDWSKLCKLAPDLAAFTTAAVLDIGKTLFYRPEVTESASSILPQPLKDILSQLPGEDFAGGSVDAWTVSRSEQGSNPNE